MLFSVFRRKSIFDEKITDWIFSCFSWALESFGSDIFYEDTILLKPTDKFFADLSPDSDEGVRNLFEMVKRYAGMEKWHCVLKKGGTSSVKKDLPDDFTKKPAGSFSCSKEDPDEIIITYNPELTGKKDALIATFAHELSHFLCLTAKDSPPGGEGFWEPAADLVSVFMGFGIFSITSSYKFSWFSSLYSHSWEVKTQGYLSQYALIYILAIFCTLKKIDYKEISPYLSKSLRSLYKKSLNDIGLNERRIEKLGSIEKTLKP